MNQHGSQGEQHACTPLRRTEGLPEEQDGPEQRRHDLEVGEDLEGSSVHVLQGVEEESVVDGVAQCWKPLKTNQTHGKTIRNGGRLFCTVLLVYLNLCCLPQ